MTEGVIACYVISQCRFFNPFTSRLSLTLKELVMWAVFPLLYVSKRKKATTAVSFHPFIPKAPLSLWDAISRGVQTRPRTSAVGSLFERPLCGLLGGRVRLNLRDTPAVQVREPTELSMTTGSTVRSKTREKRTKAVCDFFTLHLPNMSSLSVHGVITPKTAEDQTEGCCEDFGYALGRVPNSKRPNPVHKL